MQGSSKPLASHVHLKLVLLYEGLGTTTHSSEVLL